MHNIKRSKIASQLIRYPGLKLVYKNYRNFKARIFFRKTSDMNKQAEVENTFT